MTYSNREQSFGFILFGWARAGAIVTSLISTSTILALGYQDAGCSGNGLSLPKPNASSQWNSTLNMTINITGTPIQGPCLTSALLPGSVISLGLSIEGAVSMVLAPLSGAVSDRTSYRWALHVICGIFLTSSVIIHIPFYAQVSPIYFGSWFPLLVSEIYGGIFYNLGLVPYNAYLGELAKDSCEADTPEWKRRMGEISSKVIASMYALMAFLLILNTVLSGVLGDVPSLMVVTALSGVVMILGLVISAMRLPQVEPRAEVKVSLASAFCRSWSDILTCVWQTATTCPNIAIMYAALALTEAGANACTTLAAIYLADQIGLSSGNISFALFATVLMGAVGAFIGNKLGDAGYSILFQQKVACVLYIVFMSLFPLLNSFVPTFLVMSGVGCGIGMNYSVNRANMASTIPVGQEAKYFGVYMVLQKSLTWAPQLLYAFLNQVGLRVLAVTGIIPFFLLGLGGFFILDVTAIAKERQLLEKNLEKSIAVA